MHKPDECNPAASIRPPLLRAVQIAAAGGHSLLISPESIEVKSAAEEAFAKLFAPLPALRRWETSAAFDAQRKVFGWLLSLDGAVGTGESASMWLAADSRPEIHAGWDALYDALRSEALAADQAQKARFAGTRIGENVKIPPSRLRTYCSISTELDSLLQQAMEQMHAGSRVRVAILRVARTIADLSGRATIEPEHLIEAAQLYRFPSDPV